MAEAGVQRAGTKAWQLNNTVKPSLKSKKYKGLTMKLSVNVLVLTLNTHTHMHTHTQRVISASRQYFMYNKSTYYRTILSLFLNKHTFPKCERHTEALGLS